jgi:predicted RNA binding protein YcfA (HicA-like mRNA interferase family)
MAKLPVNSGREAVKAFERAGWVKRWQVGSHVTMEKAGHRATLSVPLHRELDKGLLRRLIRDTGMAVDEFVKLLK